MNKDNVIKIDRMPSSNTDNCEHVFSEQFMQRKQDMIDRVRQEDLERNTQHKKRSSVAAAVILLLCMVSIGVPVAAKAIAYLNGNTKNNFKEKIDKTLEKNEENPYAIEDIDIKVLDVSKIDNEIIFNVQMTFTEDITELVNQCYEYAKIHGDIWDSAMLKNSVVNVDETWESEGDFCVTCSIVSHDEHILNLKVTVTSLSDTENAFEGKHRIILGFENINTGDHVYEGFSKYIYEFDTEIYEDTDIMTRPLELNTKESSTYDSATFSITSYALTQNGIQFYGTENAESDSIQRLHAKDDLGNQYLFYPRAIDNPNNTEKTKDEQTETHLLFEVYDGPAIYLEEGVTYQTILDPNATYLTVYIEEEIVGDSLTYFVPLSDSVTIPLTELKNEE